MILISLYLVAYQRKNLFLAQPSRIFSRSLQSEILGRDYLKLSFPNLRTLIWKNSNLMQDLRCLNWLLTFSQVEACTHQGKLADAWSIHWLIWIKVKAFLASLTCQLSLTLSLWRHGLWNHFELIEINWKVRSSRHHPYFQILKLAWNIFYNSVYIRSHSSSPSLVPLKPYVQAQSIQLFLLLAPKREDHYQTFSFE